MWIQLSLLKTQFLCLKQSHLPLYEKEKKIPRESVSKQAKDLYSED